MLKLNLKKKPEWVQMPDGVSIKVAPFSTAVFMKVLPSSQEKQTELEQTREFMLALAQGIILEWKGVGDHNGDPVPVTDEFVACLLDDFSQYNAFLEKVGLKAIEVLSEKKPSKPSPNGSSVVGTNIAGAAKKAARTARKK